MAEPHGDFDDDTNVDQWGARRLFDAVPSAAPTPMSRPVHKAPVIAADPPGDDTDFEPVELDDPPPQLDPAPSGDNETDPPADAGAKRTALALVTAVAVAIATIVAALTVFIRPDSPAAVRHQLPSAAPQVSPAATTTGRPPDQDQAIPFTASANCPAGSTSAQALTDTASDSAWICVRGAPGGQVDGQVLHIDLGHIYVLSAVSVAPGAVPKTPGGKDDWLAHRVVSRLQYIFNDDDRTVFTQDTANTHGPVTTPLPHRLLASRVTVIILQTARPPASPLPSPDTTAAQPGLVASVLGADPASPQATETPAADPDPAQPDTDPVDATFAISTMTFFGHQPN